MVVKPSYLRRYQIKQTFSYIIYIRKAERTEPANSWIERTEDQR